MNIKNAVTIIRQLPNNIEAEQIIIGALLNNNEYIDKVIDFLKSEHFYMPIHQKIYNSILKFVEKGVIANPITLKSFFEKEEVLLDAGVTSFEYLVKLAANAQIIVDITALAKAIYELAIRRQLIEIGEDVVNEAHQEDIDGSINKRIEKVEQRLFNLASYGDNKYGFNQLKSAVLEALHRVKLAKERGGGVSGVPTKFIDLDKMTGGLQDSDLIIIAARPSMGKTALAINIAINAAENFQEEYRSLNKNKFSDQNNTQAKSVGFISLEMSSEQIATRILAIKTGIDSGKIRIGMINKDEFNKLTQESSKLSSIPIYMDDTPALSISAIRTRVRRMKRQQNLGLLVIDYLQLIRGSGAVKDGNRVQEIGEISQGLKAIAKELNIPVVALSQLSRAVESREDKKPLLSDLRESGNIEQDADIVMFIYREEYYLSRKAPIESEKNLEWQEHLNKVKNTAEIIIAKQRNGPVGSCTLRFDMTTTIFTNLDRVHSEANLVRGF